MRLSLRGQLSLWVGSAVLFTSLAMIFITQQVATWSLERSIDESLQKSSNMVASVVASDITTDEESYALVIGDLATQELPFAPTLLRVVSPSGKSIIELGTLKKLSSSLVQELDYHLQLAQDVSGSYSTVSIQGEAPFRTYSILVSNPRTHVILAHVQAVESLSQIIQSRNSLMRDGLLAGLVATLLAVIVSQLLLRRGLKPLARIMETIDAADYRHLRLVIQEDIHTTELEQLSKSLSAMWMRLDTAANEERRAVGNMSHDLRTPLTALQGQLEVLLAQPDMSEETRDSVCRMLNETQRLIRMVKDLLLNVQLESNPAWAMEEVNLRGILDETIGDMWTLMEGLESKVTSDEDVTILGNHDLLKQMLVNIVDNAIKFTRKGGNIELALFGEDKWAVLRVSDTGRGIPSEQLPHVMKAFYRIGALQRPEGQGARLGLAIVSQIVDFHGGQIEIQSKENVGTSVIVRLPLAHEVNPVLGAIIK